MVGELIRAGLITGRDFLRRVQFSRGRYENAEMWETVDGEVLFTPEDQGKVTYWDAGPSFYKDADGASLEIKLGRWYLRWAYEEDE